jgi:AraC-like DNA-binding protein
LVELIVFEVQMKNASVASFKNDSREISRCKLVEDFRPVLSDRDFVPGGKGSFSKQKTAPSPRPFDAETAQKINQSITYMRQHLDKPLQATVLAALVNISTSHYFALFKRHTGCAPIDYFTRLRMQCACRLLDSTSSSVKEIADALGYGDPFYFSRVFKSVNRVAPSEYRMRKKKTQAEAGPDGAGQFCFQATKMPEIPRRTSLAERLRAAIFSSAGAETCAV